MRRLARRTTVIWINSIGMRAPRPGTTRRPIHRYWRKLKSTLRGLRRDPSGMWVFSPLFIPRYTPRAVRLNGALLRAQVWLICKLLGIRRASAWVTVPTAAHAVLRHPFARRVFNRCDDFSRFPNADHELIARLERELIDGCDTTFFVSPDLHERERRRSPNPVLLGHGVDYHHFARDRGNPLLRVEPDPLAGIRTAIIGFYGGIEDYTVDVGLLILVARTFRDCTLVIAGPRSVGTQTLEAEPNVRILGPIPYERLPAIATRFDVGIMPWRQNAWIRSCNPIKMKEYLALGFPIVSTPFPALESYREHIRVGATPDDFLRQIEAALHENDPVRRAARRAAVREESWDARATRAGTALGLPVQANADTGIEPKPTPDASNQLECLQTSADPTHASNIS